MTKLRHVKERDAELSKDVRTLTALTQAQLDDRQKVRMRIERLQHEHRTEAKFFAKQRVKHDAELVAIDERIAARRQAIEQLDDTLKLANYVRTADYAKTVRRRELRSGRQRDHIEWFQRQATRMEELINVPFRPEEPGGAAGTIKYFREQEAHAASLWSKINDREREAAELGVEIRALEAEVAVLSHAGQGEPAEGNDDGVFDGFGDDSSPVFASTVRRARARVRLWCRPMLTRAARARDPRQRRAQPARSGAGACLLRAAASRAHRLAAARARLTVAPRACVPRVRAARARSSSTMCSAATRTRSCSRACSTCCPWSSGCSSCSAATSPA